MVTMPHLVRPIKSLLVSVFDVLDYLRLRIGHGLSYSGILYSKNMHYRFASITERYITSRFNIYRYGCQSDLSDCCRSISISVQYHLMSVLDYKLGSFTSK